MRRDTATEREESHEELALRATLHAHASEMGDTEAAWERVAPRLAANKPLATRQWRVGPLVGWTGRPQRALVAAILAAVLVVSIGSLAGFAYIRGCFWGGSSFICSNLLQPDGTNYFDKVNQSQELQGVTVTITSAYADRGATLIGYRTTMTPKLASQWGAAYLVVMTVRSGSGELVGTLGDKASSAAQRGLCDDPARNQGETVCYLHFGPAHPGDAANSISLNIEVSGVQLHNGPTDSLLSGSWSFQFTLPFHQMTRDLDSTK